MTMERRSSILALLVLSASLLQTALAAEYIVGDSTGWNYATEEAFYNTWASQQTFKVGDTLKFNWVGTHDVVQLSPADAQACSTTNELNKWEESGVSVPLTTAGDVGFICSIAGHCSGGFMKMTLTVTAADATSPPPPPIANSPPPPAPPTPTVLSPPTDAGSSLMHCSQPLLIAALALFAATTALFV